MRPWTIVVLSDYGRDRVTYQSYERLFDPELTPRSLPIANPAVVRMQAVFATMDWLSTRLRGDAQVWRLLQGPARHRAHSGTRTSSGSTRSRTKLETGPHGHERARRARRCISSARSRVAKPPSTRSSGSRRVR